MTSEPPIVLLTDFGQEDPFVGIMKGVTAKIAPKGRVIDLTHSIPPGDVKRAAITIWQSSTYFPDDSIFLSVVDPGVGTSRRGIVVVNDTHKYVGPDNGLFSFILNESSEIWELKDPEYQLAYPGTTFHGRDIFAPAAAYLVNGVQGSQFGPPVSDVRRLSDPVLLYEKSWIQGEVLFADHFGNLLTSLGRLSRLTESLFRFDPWLRSDSEIDQGIEVAIDRATVQLLNGRKLPWVNTFAEIPSGTCAALIGSSGLMEIAANRNSAAEILGLSEGELLTLSF
jgi:hypothetical protein